MRKALSFEIFIASDFILGIACGYIFKMQVEHRDVASSVAFFMLEAVGFVTTVLSLRSAGIVFGDAEVCHSFRVQLCIFAWFTFLAGLIGCASFGGNFLITLVGVISRWYRAAILILVEM